ncbi:MAG: preprotein translocase subunit SecY [Lachnospiraceae bacterium]|nr:preprotein translocase subunit SecY [Lachnospiraceae bacterium]
MFKTLRNAWKIADLRQKILFTAFIILLYRVGTAIPIPFINAEMLKGYMDTTAGSMLQYLNILSGGAFANATLFALGISPYITSSIVIQLLAVAIPALEKLSKEGEEGQKKLNQITRYVTVGLALLSSFGYYSMLNGYGIIQNTEPSWFSAVVIIACYCAGSALVMWLAEKINDKGIGNGISIILFANIVSRGPSLVLSLWQYITNPESKEVSRTVGILIAVLAIIIGLAMVAFIVFITDSERRIPINYAKKTVGRKMYGGQSSNLPIKLNMTGVMPIIFASSIISIPSTIAVFVPPKEGTFWKGFSDLFNQNHWFYAVLTFVLIIAFAYFYVAISFNPVEISNNLKNNGGTVPGIRPGRPTADYIRKVTNRITLIGAILLGIVAVVPLIANLASGGKMRELAFGGSSIIIVVGVVLETAREIEGQMTMRHYKGFLQ